MTANEDASTVEDAEAALELLAMVDELRRRCPWLSSKSDSELAEMLVETIRKKAAHR